MLIVSLFNPNLSNILIAGRRERSTLTYQSAFAIRWIAIHLDRTQLDVCDGGIWAVRALVHRLQITKQEAQAPTTGKTSSSLATTDCESRLFKWLLAHGERREHARVCLSGESSNGQWKNWAETEACKCARLIETVTHADTPMNKFFYMLFLPTVQVMSSTIHFLNEHSIVTWGLDCIVSSFCWPTSKKTGKPFIIVFGPSEKSFNHHMHIEGERIR